MFDIANERVNTRQVNSSTYYDKKIKNEKITSRNTCHVFIKK